MSPFHLLLINSTIIKKNGTQFGGQPYFNDFLNKNFKSTFTNAFGEKNGKAMMAATAGSSVLTLVLLLKRQKTDLGAQLAGSLVSARSSSSRSTSSRSSGSACLFAPSTTLLSVDAYVLVGTAEPTRRRSARAASFRSSATRAWASTAALRGPLRATHPVPLLCVSFASDAAHRDQRADFRNPLTQLFGGSAFTKEYIFKLEDYRSATWYQNFVASIAGSVSSIAISQPLDVIKVRFHSLSRLVSLRCATDERDTTTTTCRPVSRTRTSRARSAA